MIIGLVGQLGSGKDFITENILIPLFGKEKCQIISLADSLKVELMVHMNINFEKLYIKKNQDSRKLLQTYGTDIMRRKYGNDLWIKYVDSWIKVHKFRGKEVIIIPDIRFQNEAEYIKNNDGILIKVVASDRNQEKVNEEGLKNEVKHISELGIDNIKCDFYLDNSKKNKDNVKRDLQIFLKNIN